MLELDEGVYVGLIALHNSIFTSFEHVCMKDAKRFA